MPARWSTRCWVVAVVVVLSTLYIYNRKSPSTKLGEWSSDLKYQGKETTRKEWRRRASTVKEAFLHAYNAYESRAFPMDELRPLTGDGVQLWVLHIIEGFSTGD